MCCDICLLILPEKNEQDSDNEYDRAGESALRTKSAADPEGLMRGGGGFKDCAGELRAADCHAEYIPLRKIPHRMDGAHTPYISGAEKVEREERA